MPQFVRARQRLAWPKTNAQDKKGAIPIIGDITGFMAYDVVYAPDDTMSRTWCGKFFCPIFLAVIQSPLSLDFAGWVEAQI